MPSRGGQDSSHSVSIVTGGANPVVTINAPSSLQGGQSYNVSISVSDSDDDLASMGIRWQGYGLVGGSPWNISGGSAGETITLTAPASGNVRLRGDVWDHNSHGIVTEWLEIPVTGANNPPTATLTGPENVAVGDQNSWSFTINDQDGNLWRWRVGVEGSMPSWIFTGGSSYSSSFTETFSSTGGRTIRLEVEDASGEETSETVSVTVGKADQPEVSSEDETIDVNTAFEPDLYGGAGSGAWQWEIPGYDGWNDNAWMPPGAGTYPFNVRKLGDSSYNDSNVAGVYYLTVEKYNQSTVSSVSVSITLGQSLSPTYNGGSGTGAWQFMVSGQTNWPTNGQTGTRLSNGSVVTSWTPSTHGSYTFYVRKLGDATYKDSNTSAARTLTVTLPNYTLTTSASPSGWGSVTGGGTYQSGANASVTAMANSGYGFVNWSGAATGTSNPVTISMTSNKSVTANFAVIPSGTVSGPATGTVGTENTYNLTNIGNTTDWRWEVDLPGGGAYEWAGAYGTENSHNWGFGSGPGEYRFRAHLRGAGVNAYTNEVVVTAVPAYTLTTAASPSNGGSVLGGGTYPSGMNASVTATANSGYVFTGWSGAASGTLNPVTISMTSDKSLTANFEPLPPPPAITSPITASGAVGQNFSYTITATESPTSYDATSLPAWLNRTGAVLSGVPTAVGSFEIGISGSNSGGTGNGTVTLTIAKGSQTIAFAALPDKNHDAPAFTLAADATSGLPVSFSIVSGLATISNNTVTLIGSGSVTIRAAQGGGANYNAAPNVDRSFTVNPPPPVITSATAASGNLGAAFNYTITATNSPTGFSATGLPPGLTTDGSTISGTPTQMGTFNVSLSASNASGTGPNAVLVLSIGKAQPELTVASQTAYDQSLVVTSAMLPAQAQAPGGLPTPTGPVTYTATYSAFDSIGQPVTPTIDPFTPDTFGQYGFGPLFGPVTVTASYAGDANYASATKTVTFVALDTIAPSPPPSGLERILLGPTSFSLEWNGSSDASDAPGLIYDISVDGGSTVHASTPRLAFGLSGVSPSTTYAVKVRARDVFDNASAWSSALSVTTPASGDNPASQAPWIDVNGDGIRDEIFSAGSAAFTHSIVEMRSQTLTVEDWELGFQTQTVFGEDGRIYFYHGWVPEWTSYKITVTDVRPEVQILAEPGYEYGIYRAVSPTHYQRILSPTVLEEGSSSAIHTQLLGWWPEQAYWTSPLVLVRLGRMAHSATVSTSSGATLGTALLGATRGLGGLVSATLPPNGQLILSAKEVLNKVLQNGPKVVWEVWDAINNVPVGSTTLGDFLDIGINATGQWQVGITLDDTTAVWFNVTVQPPPPPVLAVDANRDGQISFDANDATSASAPYRFWLNDDNDVSFQDPKWTDRDPERYPPTQADSADQIINSSRDGEDLARIWINAAGLIDTVKDPAGDLYLGLKWKNTNGTHPSIRLFRSADPNGGLGYIKDATIGLQQASITPPGGVGALRSCLGDADAATVANPPADYPWTSGITTVEPPTDVSNIRAADFIFRKDALTDVFGNRTTGYLLFEGVQEGKGELSLVIVRKKSDGTWEKVSDGGSVWMQLDNICRMYVRVHSEPMASNFPFPWQDVVATFPPPFPYTESVSQDHAITIPDGNLGYGAGDTVENLSQFPFSPTAGEQNKCVVFVHGIDMSVPEVHGYSESFFKRLWWEGYRGRFVSFRWSTPLSTDGLFTPFADQPNVSIFNSGEYRSWKCGAALRKYVDALRTQLGSGSVIGVVGHSLGNAAVGEALWQGMRPNSYVAMEAAVSLSCYYWSNPAPGEAVPPANARLVNAESGHPTPLDTGSGGYYGYLASLQTIAGLNRVTYYNANDFWLATGRTAPELITGITLDVDWVTNQVNHKPDDRYGPGQYTYDPDVNWARFRRGTSFNRTVLDPHERMPFVSRSRTSALGTSAPPPGFTGRNLGQDYGFGTQRPDHSGQFQRAIQLMYAKEDGTPWVDQNGAPMPLHRRLMNDLGVAP